MKYLITFLLAFITIIGYSQPVQLRSGGSVTPLDSNLIVGKSLRVPVFQDTTNANTYRTLDSAGKLIFTREDNNLWVRTTEKAWSLISIGGTGVDSIWLNSDSSQYLYGGILGNVVGSFPTLQKILAPEPGQRATLRASNDSVYVGFNETGLPQSNSYLVSTGGVVLVDSTLTVTAPILWVYRGADSSEISNQVFTINTAATGGLRTDIIWIDSLGVFTKTVGTPDSVTAVAPQIDYNGIIVAYADIDGSTITVNGVSSFQGNGVVYTQGTGVNNGQAKTDSVNFNYNEATRNLTLSGAYVSNIQGDVAYRLVGGSGVRAYGGNGRLYLDGINSATLSSVYLRTGSGLGQLAVLLPSGNFKVGNSDTDVPSAKLNVESTTKGFLKPRMTAAERIAIGSPATGLEVFDTDSAYSLFWDGSVWKGYASGGGSTTIYTGDGSIIEDRMVTFSPAGTDTMLVFRTPDKEAGFGIVQDEGLTKSYSFLGSLISGGFEYDAAKQIATIAKRYGNQDTLTVVIGTPLRNNSEAGDSALIVGTNGVVKKAGIGGGGSGSGVNYVVASSAPSDTTTFWLDTSGGFRRVWPLKQRVVDEWQIVQWYDPIAQFFSSLKPLYVLGTGQSNMLYRGTGGDLTPDSRVLTWNTTTSVWEVADFVTANTNNIALQFAKNVAKYQNRVVRYVVVAQGSQAIDEWFPDSTKTDQIVAIINTAQIDSFDVILFRQGEANADLGNTEAEYALKVDTVFNAYRDSAWFGASGQIILGGLNEQYQNTGVFDYYQHVNDPQNGGEGYVGVQVLGLSQAGGIHQDGATIDTVGARYYQAFSGQSRQYALSNQPYASWNTRNDLALSPSPTTMPGFRVHLNNTHLGRGMFFRMNTTTSSGEIGYNNSTTSGLDTASIFINQSGNIGIGQPNNTLTTNISAFEFKPKLNTPILFSLANSTSSARFQFDTSVRVIQPLTMYNTNVAGGTIQLKTSNTTNVESGRIRFTKGNTAGADNYLGAFLHFNGSDNTFYIGTNNTNTSVTTADDINVVRIPRAGTGMGVLTTPTSALHTTSFATGYVAKTANYTATIADHTIECTANTFQITLPTAVGITGREYTIVNSGSGTITIATTSSQTFTNITGTPTTLTLSPVGAGAIVSYSVKPNGANWIVTGKVKNE